MSNCKKERSKLSSENIFFASPPNMSFIIYKCKKKSTVVCFYYNYDVNKATFAYCYSKTASQNILLRSHCSIRDGFLTRNNNYLSIDR